MQKKQQKWRWGLIAVVTTLTIYNILPTLFYYAKPLQSPIEEAQGKEIATSIVNRMTQMEKDAADWVASYCSLQKITPSQITLDKQDPSKISVRLSKHSDADRLRTSLSRAGALIPFVPGQLKPLHGEDKEVLVQRRISNHLDPSHFLFTSRTSFRGELQPLYVDWVLDRGSSIASALAGVSAESSQIQAALAGSEEALFSLATKICQISQLENQTLVSSLYKQITQGLFENRKETVTGFIHALENTRDRLKKEKADLQKANDSESFALLRLIEQREWDLARAETQVKKYRKAFESGENPCTATDFLAELRKNAPLIPTTQTLDLQGKNPLFTSLIIDWARGEFQLILRPEVNKQDPQENQWIMHDLALASRLSGEQLATDTTEITFPFHQLTDTQSLLLLNTNSLLTTRVDPLVELIQSQWHPTHPDLTQAHFPIVSYDQYQNCSALERKLCLYVEASQNALQVTLKGLGGILLQAQNGHPDLLRSLQQDMHALNELLQGAGFDQSAFSGADYILTNTHPLQDLLAASREDFRLLGTKKFAALELSNVEQRMLTENKIATRIHEDLLKWRDEYFAAQVSLESRHRSDIPAPTRSTFWSNIALSFQKYFRGDERKIIRWGLDLSGGKTVQIELRDHQGNPITEESDIKQGMDELALRIQKMGVSDAVVRQVGTHISIDFPGLQSVSAAELIRASSMSCHIVNEKFSSVHGPFASAANLFLQGVWNEAVVTNRKDVKSLNEIARRHLYGAGEEVVPQSEAARILYEQGLRLDTKGATSAVNEEISQIAIWRGEDLRSWQYQSHPLLLVFRNYALQGMNLSNIQAGYDPSQGNFLSFEVKPSAVYQGETVRPQEDLHHWSSLFSKEGLRGTLRDSFTPPGSKGWRMAVILNDSVINAPALESAIQNSGMIRGRFSQREINQLISDLKAGSLTFTPHILSEKNISPELGKTDRVRGVAATGIALILVIAAMTLYYRFAGLVASIAVLFNLLILWAILQNIDVALTLPGIAGIILTVGMAVDANVLVFERFKEEWKATGRLAASMKTAYSKAFTAILDSNVTTILAAYILLQFDTGPIKGFAMTLITGVVSSMFTALFMTRTYFESWVQKNHDKTLTMSSAFSSSSYAFLKRAPLMFLTTLVLLAMGSWSAYVHRNTFLGMDFTGGFSLPVEIAPTEMLSKDFGEAVAQALLEQGLSKKDFQVRTLSPDNQLNLLFAANMDQEGMPFYQLEGTQVNNHDGRVAWILHALGEQGYSLTSRSLASVDRDWTAMGGQMSNAMCYRALIGLAAAFFAVFLYLLIRFELAYAVSALVCLMLDVFVSLSMMAIFHAAGAPLQFDLNSIAALMTIIGYSLNDKIIVFDRIREDVEKDKKESLPVIVNRALNATLSRTAITSGTTLLVLFALVGFGGPSIFGFSLSMTTGVVIGTLSSWFIAAPLVLMLNKARG